MAEVNLLPAYLINGEDQLKRETVLKRLRSRLEAMGDLDFNCDTFDGKDALGGDIVAACNTMPFGIDKRLVIVRNADDLKKADSEALVAYLTSPADFTVLDLGAQYRVDPEMFLSKGRATPFAGWEVQGRAVLTVVGGKEVYDDNYESNR